MTSWYCFKWNPVKELKEIVRAYVAQLENVVESGEGIESYLSFTPWAAVSRPRGIR